MNEDLDTAKPAVGSKAERSTPPSAAIQTGKTEPAKGKKAAKGKPKDDEGGEADSKPKAHKKKAHAAHAAKKGKGVRSPVRYVASICISVLSHALIWTIVGH